MVGYVGWFIHGGPIDLRVMIPDDLCHLSTIQQKAPKDGIGTFFYSKDMSMLICKDEGMGDRY
ncbi:uncharacterized protein G2W53_044069 [Senna tora]|uniref:Uncharacterized protein n=1 Tax=Senna tora TaxID=362788 RepID=A0A834SLR1_9FABA|nr:uncharacterized protein G2W53_044069 [Senna tora]